jgi:hypothetical protein
MAKIFLCHASEDKQKVREVYRRLKVEGFQPWLDEEDILPGQEWDRAIRKALRDADFILIFLSQNSVAKRGYVQREFKFALDVLEEIPEGEIRTIPVRLDDCAIPEQFKKLQWANLFDEPSFERIVKAIQAELLKRLTSNLAMSMEQSAARETKPRKDNGKRSRHRILFFVLPTVV